MADVFISYSQQVPEPTVALADALTQRGFRPWYDVNLLPGEFFGTVIKDSITRAQAVVTIWSPPAVTSQWVPAESQMALDQKKLICVRTADLDPRILPPPFNAMNTPVWEDINGIVQALIALGARPSGLAGQTDLEALTAAAQRDWRLLGAGAGHEEIEAYLEEYGALAMFRRMAEKRLRGLPARADAPPIPAPPPVPAAVPSVADKPILRLDPGMHTAQIRRIAASANGRLLATGSDDKTVRLWALPASPDDSAWLMRTLRPPIGEGDEGKVYAVAMDPAGRWVASGGWTSKTDEFITVFDADTGKVRQRLGPLPNVVNHLAVSADGARLAAGLGGKNGVRVWGLAPSPASGRTSPAGAGGGAHSSPVHGGSGREAAEGGFILAWEDKDYGAQVYGLAFDAAGRLAAPSYDGQIRLYDPVGRLLQKAKTPGGARPYGVAFESTGRTLAVGYADSPKVDLLDAETLSPLPAPDLTGASGGNLGSVAWTVDGRLAAGGTYVSSSRPPVLCWADAGRARRTSIAVDGGTIMDLAPLPGGALAFGSADPAWGVLDTAGRQTLFMGPPGADLRNKLREHFTVSSDGRRIRFGLGFGSESPVLVDIAARTLMDAPAAAPEMTPANTTALAVTGWEDGLAPALADQPLKLRVNEWARALAIAPGGAGFALGTEFSLYRFDAAGAQVWRQPAPSACWGVNLACDGRLVIAAYGDGTIRWHRWDTGAELLALYIHLPDGPDGPRRWILWTPAGYYDCSPGADDIIGWHVNRGEDEAADFYPAGEFASAFRKPEMIDAALDDLGPAPGAAPTPTPAPAPPVAAAPSPAPPPSPPASPAPQRKGLWSLFGRKR